jgi:hypothetical protein
MSAKSSISGVRVKRVPTAKELNLASLQQEPYYVNMNKLSDLYEILCEMALSVKEKDP